MQASRSTSETVRFLLHLLPLRAYRLAKTFQAVCLIDVNEVKHSSKDYVMRKAVKGFADTILDLVGHLKLCYLFVVVKNSFFIACLRLRTVN